MAREGSIHEPVDTPWSSARHRTAISRSDLSRPLRTALLDQLVEPRQTVLDYGSGRGQDVVRLRAMGVDARGWDPYFGADEILESRDVVLLTYVLNVIEDPAERRRTLASAWSYADSTLVVATRLHWERSRVNGETFADGVKTSRETFQHLFTPRELHDLVEDVCGVTAVAAAPGVVYCFRSENDRMALLARRTLPAFAWDSESHAAALASAVSFAHARGRVPLFEEIPPDVLPVLGRASSRELAKLCNRLADPVQMAAGAKRATLDTLLYLGIDLFNGRAALSSLPISVQADIRAHFTSYQEASRRATRLLMKLRDSTYVRGAMRNSVGKLTPSALYVHRRAIPSMPIVLRLYEHCGAVAAGRPDDFTLVKLSHDKPSVSWLSYPDFESDPHPRTAWAYAVSLTDLDVTYTDYRDRANRPLLHRKEEFLAPDDPTREKYARLTRQEMRAGLYLNPQLIGHEDGWESELARCGVQLRGHRLLSRRTSE